MLGKLGGQRWGPAECNARPPACLPSCPCRADPCAGDLAALAAQHLLLVDHSLVADAAAACDALLQHAGRAGDPAAAAAALLRAQAVGAVRASDDCVRKPALAKWLVGGPPY